MIAYFRRKLSPWLANLLFVLALCVGGSAGAQSADPDVVDEICQALVKSQTSNEELLAAVLPAIETLPKPQEVG